MILCYPQADLPEGWVESVPAQYALTLATTIRADLTTGPTEFDQWSVRVLLLQAGMLQGVLHVAGRMAQPDPSACPSPMAWAAQALNIDLDDLFRRLTRVERSIRGE